MEPEINIEPYVDPERIPSSLPWAVYRATDSRSGHDVRLAVLWAAEHLAPERMRGALDWFSEAGFQAQRLTSPAMPTVLSHRSDDDSAHVATDYPKGFPVRDWLEQSGPLPVARAMHVSSVVADALARVHAAGWAHGWLNAETVWLGDGGAVTLTDVGLALAAQSVAPGRPFPYAAQSGFFSADPLRRDLQCLGLLLTHMLTGKLPDPVGVPRGDVFPVEVPGGVVQRIKNLVNPAVERPLSAAQWAEFARVGEAPEAEEPTERVDESYYESPRRARGAGFPWKPAAIGAGALAALAALILTVNSLMPDGPPDSPASTADPVAPPAQQAPAPPADKLLRIQTGPVPAAEVESTASRLRSMGFDPYIVRENGQVFFQVGAFANAEGAQTTKDQLSAAGLPIREVK